MTTEELFKKAIELAPKHAQKNLQSVYDNLSVREIYYLNLALDDQLRERVESSIRILNREQMRIVK